MNENKAKTYEDFIEFLDTKMKLTDKTKNVGNYDCRYPWVNPYRDERRNLLFNWDEVKGKDTKKVMRFLKRKLNINKYLFTWEEVPGRDDDILRNFLKKTFYIDWIGNARVEKIEDGKTIRLLSKKNFLSLKLNDEKTNVSLILDDGRADEFIVRIENENLNIYNNWINENIEKTSDGTIKLKTEKNTVSLKLNESNTQVDLKIDDTLMAELVVKLEDGNLNVYNEPKSYLFKASALDNAVKFFMSPRWGEGRRVSLLGEEWKNIIKIV
jgi:hypothetical protein